MIIGFRPVVSNKVNVNNKAAFGGIFGKKTVDEGDQLLKSVRKVLLGKDKVQLSAETLVKATEAAGQEPHKIQNLINWVRLAIKQGRLSEEVVKEAQKLAKQTN